MPDVTPTYTVFIYCDVLTHTIVDNAQLYAVARGIFASYESFWPNAGDKGRTKPAICCQSPKMCPR